MTRKFLERVRVAGRGVTSPCNMLEAAGALAHRATAEQVEGFIRYFTKTYGFALWPPQHQPLVIDVSAVAERIRRRMAYGDATILWLAETCRPAVKTFVTWNVKDFAGRTALQVQTPQQFLRGG